MLPGMMPLMMGSVPPTPPTPKSASFMGLVDEGVSVTFGAAAASRRMVAVIHWREGGTHETLTGATIGGVGATVHIQTGHSGGVTGFGVAIISAVVPTGTSGAVNCTFSGTVSNVSCGVYRLTSLDSGTPTDTAFEQSAGTTTSLSQTITVAAEGIVIAGFTGSTNATSSVGWGGVTEQYDDHDGVHRSSGFASELSAQNRVISANVTPQANSGNGMVVASWS